MVSRRPQTSWSGLRASVTVISMREPQSIRFHLAAVFLFFFALVVVLGSFSIWRLSNFNLLSADVAEVWLPTMRALGDLNNYTSDFRAVEGGNLLSSDPSETVRAKKRWRLSTGLSRPLSASSKRSGMIPPRTELYNLFKARWERLSRDRQSRCWLCRAAIARTMHRKIYGSSLARGLHRGQRHTRPADRPGGHPALRPRVSVSPRLIIRPFG